MIAVCTESISRFVNFQRYVITIAVPGGARLNIRLLIFR
jgi:hypothetical protein